MEHDLHTRVKVVNSVPPAALAADTNGTGVDSLGYESLEFVVHVGTAFVGGGFAISLEESDTGVFGGEENAVAAGDLIGGIGTGSPALAASVAIGDANRTFRFGYKGKKRHVRPVLTETGTISAGVIGVTALLGHPKVLPEPDSNT